jgi:hypothetical protein
MVWKVCQGGHFGARGTAGECWDYAQPAQSHSPRSSRRPIGVGSAGFEASPTLPPLEVGLATGELAPDKSKSSRLAESPAGRSTQSSVSPAANRSFDECRGVLGELRWHKGAPGARRPRACGNTAGLGGRVVQLSVAEQPARRPSATTFSSAMPERLGRKLDLTAVVEDLLAGRVDLLASRRKRAGRRRSARRSPRRAQRPWPSAPRQGRRQAFRQLVRDSPRC